MIRLRSSILLCCLALSLSAKPFSESKQVDPPSDSLVMINGFFAKGEWGNAVSTTLSDGVKLHCMKDERYLYLGIQTTETTHTGLDLYVATSKDNRFLFHVSSALAEATYLNGSWSDRKWELNRQWTSNKIGLYQDESGRRNSEPEGFELQFDLSLFKSETVQVAIDLKRPAIAIPSEISDSDLSGWINVKTKD